MTRVVAILPSIGEQQQTVVGVEPPEFHARGNVIAPEVMPTAHAARHPVVA